MLKRVKQAFYLIAMLSLGYVMVSQSGNLIDLVVKSEPKFILLAILAYAVTTLTAPLCSFVICSAIGSKPISYGQFFNAHTLTLPHKYIPGGVWQTVGRADMLVGDFSSEKKWLAWLLLSENCFAVAVGLMLSLSFYLFFLQSFSNILAFLIFVALVAVVVASATAVFRRKNLKAIKHNCIASLGIVCIYVLSWLVQASSFVFYAMSFLEVDLLIIIQAYYSYFAAWTAGFLSFFAPQGIGVFELVAAQLLLPKLVLSVGVALIFSYRLVILITDLIVWTVIFIYRQFIYFH